MIGWAWTKNTVEPDDILDGTRTIKGPMGRHGVRLTHQWTPADTLLEWSKAAIARGGSDGWDTAAGLAKRSVCRQLDCILVHNHMGHLLGQNYGKKALYLAALNVPGLMTLRDLVIDPRNDIEHSYTLANEAQARRACDIAEMFLAASDSAADAPAVFDYGWDFEYGGSLTAAPEDKRAVKVELTKDHEPFLFILGYPGAPEVALLNPKEETAMLCPLKDFRGEQVLELNQMIHTNPTPGYYSMSTVGIQFLRAIAHELKL